MNGCLATQAQMPASSNGPANVMQCLAGSGAKPEQHTHLARLCLHQVQTRTNQLQVAELVLNLQEQQLLLQKQLLALQEKQLAVEAAAATTAATSTPRQKVQTDMTTCLETFEKERFCSFPHRHGDATGKPETRDETRGRSKTSISCETSSNFDTFNTLSNRLECDKVPRLPN